MGFLSLFQSNPSLYITCVLTVMFSICFHEFAHAYVALKQGDSTAAERGHLTLNPMIQMGTFSIVLLLLIGISWGSVPVNPHRMRRHYSHALVSFAGPAANLILFLIFCILLATFNNADNSPLIQICSVGAILNIVLFLFNMLPVPMLDGWTVFVYLIPRLNKVSEEVKNGLVFVIFILFFTTDLFHWFYRIGRHLSAVVVSTIDGVF